MYPELIPFNYITKFDSIVRRAQQEENYLVNHGRDSLSKYFTYLKNYRFINDSIFNLLNSKKMYTYEDLLLAEYVVSNAIIRAHNDYLFKFSLTKVMIDYHDKVIRQFDTLKANLYMCGTNFIDNYAIIKGDTFWEKNGVLDIDIIGNKEIGERRINGIYYYYFPLNRRFEGMNFELSYKIIK